MDLQSLAIMESLPAMVTPNRRIASAGHCAAIIGCFACDGFGYRYGVEACTTTGETNLPSSIAELKRESLSGTYIGIDPKLDISYLLTEQTAKERDAIRVAFPKSVYDAFAANHTDRR
jgi:hypothetical protein